MKQTIVVIFFLFAAFLVAGFCPVHAADETPLLVAVQQEFEFKPVMEGQEVVHDFVIKNEGKAILEIKSVRPG